jgi:hypothetical protein
MTPSVREEELSPMHCVKAVPRNSHADAPAIEGSDSALSIATEIGEEGNHSWVGRKVDALFSPVLSFLNGKDCSDGKTSEGNNLDNDSTKSQDEEQSIAVSAAIRTALMEASEELLRDDDRAHLASRSDSSEFDQMPVMTNTDSTSKDADGDLNMDSPVVHRGIGLRLEDEDEEEGTVTNRYSIDNDDEDDHSDYRGHAQGVGHNNQDYEEDEEEEFNPFLFIKSLPPYPYAIPPGWTSRSKALPPAHPEDPPICLVLDLDETLVHCTVEPIRGADMVFPVEFNGMEYTVVSQCCLFKLLYSLDS